MGTIALWELKYNASLTLDLSLSLSILPLSLSKEIDIKKKWSLHCGLCAIT